MGGTAPGSPTITVPLSSRSSDSMQGIECSQAETATVFEQQLLCLIDDLPVQRLNTERRPPLLKTFLQQMEIGNQPGSTPDCGGVVAERS